jgi:integrase
LNKGHKIERFLSAGELARLSDALAQAERQGANPGMVEAIRLLLLTGARRNEILGLRWEWVDVERGCLHLPDSKTGAKVVPLGAPACGAPTQGEPVLGFPRCPRETGIWWDSRASGGA